MNLMKKVFAIIKKNTNEVVSFGLTSKGVYAEWEAYYMGTEQENTHFLSETFLSEKYIREQISVN